MGRKYYRKIMVLVYIYLVHTKLFMRAQTMAPMMVGARTQQAQRPRITRKDFLQEERNIFTNDLLLRRAGNQQQKMIEVIFIIVALLLA